MVPTEGPAHIKGGGVFASFPSPASTFHRVIKMELTLEQVTPARSHLSRPTTTRPHLPNPRLQLRRGLLAYHCSQETLGLASKGRLAPPLLEFDAAFLKRGLWLEEG